jgi:hypothetical protein
MLYLAKNQANELILENLNDFSDDSGNDYLFTFTHEQEKKHLFVVLTDVSLFPYAYSQFVLDLPGDLSEMTKDGEYRVKVEKGGITVWNGKAFLESVKFEQKVNEFDLGNNIIYGKDRE